MLNRWQRTIVDLRGNVVPYAQLQIRVESTQATATIYADRAGNELIPNGIVTADANGYAYFYAKADLYRISSMQPTIDWRDVAVGDAVLRQELANPDKGSAMVARGVQVVSSIAALRLLDKTKPSKHAFVTGYYAPGDGGGGAYYLDATDTTSEDNGGTVIVAADGARWKLKHAGATTIRQFGARGDGVSSDAEAIQRALDATPAYGELVIPEGDFLIDAELTRELPIKIKGAGVGRTRIKLSSDVIAITFDASDIFISGVEIGTDFIRQDVTPPGIDLGIGLRFLRGSSRIVIDECRFSGLNTGILFVDASNDIQLLDSSFANLHYRVASEDTGVGGYGAIFQACQRTLVRGCLFEKSINRRGLYFSTSPSATQVSKNHQVIGNKFFGRLGGADHYRTSYEIHVKLLASSDVIIMGNVFDGGIGGVFYEPYPDRSEFSDNVVISGNVFKNFNPFNQNSSVICGMGRVYPMRRWIITNNVVENCAGNFVLLPNCEDVKINNNIVKMVQGTSDAVWCGIKAVAVTAMHDLEVSGNTIDVTETTDGKPLEIRFGSDTPAGDRLTNVRLTNNVMRAGNSFDVLTIFGRTDLNILGLVMEGNTLSGHRDGAGLRISSCNDIQARVYNNSVPQHTGFSITNPTSGQVSYGGNDMLIPALPGVVMYEPHRRDGRRSTVGLPTIGTWKVGDLAYTRNPVAAGHIGWVCVEAGSPGTWKKWGDIEA